MAEQSSTPGIDTSDPSALLAGFLGDFLALSAFPLPGVAVAVTSSVSTVACKQ